MLLKTLATTTLIMVGAMTMTPNCLAQGEYLSGIKWPEPPIIQPGKTDADPPSDAIVLFDGKDLSAWEDGDKWIVKDGEAIVKDTSIKTKQSFGDCQLHIEWSSPVPAKGKGQERGNSGVFLMDRYELQVLDSYDNQTYYDGQASAIYKQTPPMVNAMRKPGEWNTYDIIWTAPRFNEDGKLESPAYMTVLHNGVLTINHFALEGETLYNELPKYHKHGKLPIHLQNHGNAVKFRNIWVREFKPIVGERQREPYFLDHDTKKETPVKKTASVKGRIQIGDEPLREGKVRLHPINGGSPIESDLTDGKFRFKDVALGRYSVSIETIDRAIPRKYRNSDQSGLMVDVAGDRANEFDLKLRSR